MVRIHSCGYVSARVVTYVPQRLDKYVWLSTYNKTCGYYVVTAYVPKKLDCLVGRVVGTLGSEAGFAGSMLN